MASREMDTQTTLGTEFAHAWAAKDAGRIRELVHPEIDFRALTPNRHWEAADVDSLIEILFGNWLEDEDHVESVESVESDSFADRERVGYRLGVRSPDGHFLVEQQAYIEEREGRIGWMRVVCSGFRPAG
jgi:hypothetical protein